MAELEPVNPLTGQRRAQTLGGLTGPHSEGEQNRRRRLPASQRGDQLERRAVAPVQVVQHQHERPLVGYQAQEATDRAMGPVALVRDGRRGAVGSLQRREHLGELGAQLLIPGLVLGEVLRDHVRVEGIDPDAERHLALELGGSAREHDVAALLGARAELSKEARLADARLPLQSDVSRPVVVESVERRVELLELGLASNERGACPGLRVHLR